MKKAHGALATPELNFGKTRESDQEHGGSEGIMMKAGCVEEAWR